MRSKEEKSLSRSTILQYFSGMNKEKLSFREYLTLLPHLSRHKWYYITGLVFLVLTDGGLITIPRYLGRAVDQIESGASASLIGRLMLTTVVIAGMVAIGRFGWRMFVIGTSRRIQSELRIRMYNKLLMFSESFYAKNKTGNIMARMTNDLNAIRMASGIGLIAFVDGTFMSLVIIIMLISTYGILGLIVIIPLPIISMMVIVLSRFIAPLFKRVQERFARISEHVQETMAGIRVIKSFVKEENNLKKFHSINAEYSQANMNLIRFWGMFFPMIIFVSGLSILLLLYFGGQRVLEGRMHTGDFVTILSYIGMLIWPAMSAGWVVNLIQRGAASMKRINMILQEKPDIIDLPGADDTPPQGNLEFRSLQYSYGQKTILSDVSFTVAEGQSVGILGRTGSGKSTLIKLISRLLDPPENTIFIGGRDIRQLTRSALRRSMGIVSQDVFLFSDTIRKNILFSRSDADEKDMEWTVKAAGLQADLPFFPDNLETTVGEKGISLSGGQRQRIAIARAIIIEPDILILDDALSSVDADTEEQILNQLFQRRRGRTTVMISHRVSALSRCDKCIVMENGRISAQGNHQQLMAQEGFYREIAELQKLEESGKK